MLQKRMFGFGVLLSGLILASCNQTALPALSPDAVSSETVSSDPVRRDLAEFKTLQLQVNRGERAAPVDSTGQPVDLALLISQLERDLANPVLDPSAAGLSAQAIYAQRIYTDISADDSFTAHLAYNKSAFRYFNWSTDGCSIPGIPSKFQTNVVFYPACVQHDFGYRNVKAYPNLMNESHRDWVDAQFKRHMRTICSQRNILLRPGCYVDAEAFWGAVRNFGRDSFYH